MWLYLFILRCQLFDYLIPGPLVPNVQPLISMNNKPQMLFCIQFRCSALWRCWHTIEKERSQIYSLWDGAHVRTLLRWPTAWREAAIVQTPIPRLLTNMSGKFQGWPFCIHFCTHSHWRWWFQFECITLSQLPWDEVKMSFEIKPKSPIAQTEPLCIRMQNVSGSLQLRRFCDVPCSKK